MEQVGQLLWAVGGVTADGVSGPTRTAPSAGGLYPISLYLVAGEVEGLEPGVYVYRWDRHDLQRIAAGDAGRGLSDAALGQRAVAEAPGSIVLGAAYDRTRRRYGRRGVERYVHIDAGHAAQNVGLQAQTIGLTSVMIGAFDDNAVANRLNLRTVPIYILPVGYSR